MIWVMNRSSCKLTFASCQYARVGNILVSCRSDMKLLLASISIIISTFNAVAQDGGSAELEIRVKGIKQASKTVNVALYSRNDNFPDESRSMKNTGIISANGEVAVVFEVPYGEYAVAVFVDANNNGKLDKNILGYPKEQFGFSNDYRPKTTALRFEHCRFVFSEQQRQVVIELRK